MARDIVAIDVHVHLSDETTQKAKGDRTAQMARYFGRERPPSCRYTPTRGCCHMQDTYGPSLKPASATAANAARGPSAKSSGSGLKRRADGFNGAS